jgi:NADH-quinone oxidoreductase subunit M
MTQSTILSVVVFLPLLAGLLLLVVPRARVAFCRWWTLAAMIAGLAASGAALSLMQRGTAGMQLVQRVPWIPSLGVDYFLGVDGISIYLVLLASLLGPLVVLSAWRAVGEKVREFHFLLLLLQTGILGAFLSLDLFLFYIFWELMLIPMYLLIGVWGGPRRVYAAIKFVLYTIAGSLLMLVAIVYLYLTYHAQTGTYTFDLLQLYGTELTGTQQGLLFAAFALAFSIKVPVFPLHTWLPDAHVEAPTAGSVILAGVLLKLGTYGFLRFALPLFPGAARAAQPLFLVLAVIGIVYGALVAMVQTDIKKLVAYSSVSHLGYCLLGLFAFNVSGFSGSLFQMINHGLSTGALFLLVGMVYERRHTREIADFGGLTQAVPWFATAFVVVTLSSIGLPGLNGFVGEFLVLVGAFGANRLAAAGATTGVVLGAVYLLWLVRRFLFGPLVHEENRKMPDLNPREITILLPIVLLIVYLGVHPGPFLRRMEPSLRTALSLSTPGPGRLETLRMLQLSTGSLPGSGTGWKAESGGPTTPGGTAIPALPATVPALAAAVSTLAAAVPAPEVAVPVLALPAPAAGKEVAR